jgi:hypothetical protein
MPTIASQSFDRHLGQRPGWMIVVAVHVGPALSFGTTTIRNSSPLLPATNWHSRKDGPPEAVTNRGRLGISWKPWSLSSERASGDDGQESLDHRVHLLGHLELQEVTGADRLAEHHRRARGKQRRGIVRRHC